MYTLENTPSRGEEGKISADGIWAKKYEKRREQKGYCFASSPWRPYTEDKRMVLEHTHGLFIT
jgi:hypothetical protein